MSTNDYNNAMICEIAIRFDKNKTLYFYSDDIEDQLQNVDYLYRLYCFILDKTKNNYKFSALESVLRSLYDDENMKKIIDEFLYL